jgi:hypothetical protein
VVEHSLRKRKVGSSILPGGSIFFSGNFQSLRLPAHRVSCSFDHHFPSLSQRNNFFVHKVYCSSVRNMYTTSRRRPSRRLFATKNTSTNHINIPPSNFKLLESIPMSTRTFYTWEMMWSGWVLHVQRNKHFVVFRRDQRNQQAHATFLTQTTASGCGVEISSLM